MSGRCSSGVLSREMLALAPACRARLAENIHKLENFLLQSLGSDPVSLRASRLGRT